MLLCRNSPMIWWPFNVAQIDSELHNKVVTHQWSGDLSMDPDTLWQANKES